MQIVCLSVWRFVLHLFTARSEGQRLKTPLTVGNITSNQFVLMYERQVEVEIQEISFI